MTLLGQLVRIKRWSLSHQSVFKTSIPWRSSPSTWIYKWGMKTGREHLEHLVCTCSIGCAGGEDYTRKPNCLSSVPHTAESFSLFVSGAVGNVSYKIHQWAPTGTAGKSGTAGTKNIFYAEIAAAQLGKIINSKSVLGQNPILSYSYHSLHSYVMHTHLFWLSQKHDVVPNKRVIGLIVFPSW